MTLSVEKIARMLDLSAVRVDVEAAEVRALAQAAKKYGCVCAFVLPCYLPELKDLLTGTPEVGVGGVVGFPSGGHSTATKAFEARQQREQGATELDMVINVGFLRSGRLQAVEDDIRAVVEAAGGLPVKVILEAHHLNDAQVIAGSRAATVKGGQKA